MTDEDFIAQFENVSFSKDSFHHADHVRMAFLYLHRYPALEALQRFSSTLTKFAVAMNKPGLYHETITWSFLLLIRERIIRAGHGQCWDEFKACNGDLLTWKPSILDKYYKDETLASDLARTTFLFPDKGIAQP